MKGTSTSHARIYNHLDRLRPYSLHCQPAKSHHLQTSRGTQPRARSFRFLARGAMARGQQQRCLALACLVAMSVSTASAFVFKAGGTGEWRVPGQANASGGNIASYNTWAEHTRFRVGDAIAFTYEPGKDSVLIVDEKAYDACDTGSPVDTFSDGNTVFTFTKSGPFYFISGNKDNCNRNEKLVVVVMGPRAAANSTSTHTDTALAPSPAENGDTFSPPPPFGIQISPTANPEPNVAVAKAAGIAGTAAFVIGTMFYALV